MRSSPEGGSDVAGKWIQKARAKMERKGTVGKFGKATASKIAAGKRAGSSICGASGYCFIRIIQFFCTLKCLKCPVNFRQWPS